ncbi:MAG: TonB-dependent receptor [Gammaproteobacteria bacterium]|nr:TonB-dependent receptor [Gammaproteobacteria bacterium]
MSCLTGQVVWGQPGDLNEAAGGLQSNTSYEIEEIVVVAERRETLLQSTPVTVSVYTSEFLDISGIQDVRDLAAHTPGLYLGGYAMLGSFPISIRGIGSSVSGIGADDPVSLYVDGAYVGRPSGFVFQFVDVERIEVLRGPQGTLYGRNSTGGAINVISKAPSDTITAHAGMEYSRGRFNGDHFGDIRTELGVSGPVNEKVGFRISGVLRDMDGFQKNNFDENSVNGEKDYALRGSLWVTPNDRLSIKINGDYAVDEDPYAFKDVGTGIGDPDVVNVNDNPHARRKPAGMSATISYDFGSVIFESITGYRRDEFDIRSDSDLSPVSVTILNQEEKQKQITQEIRLVSNNDGRLVWSAGVYYLQAEGESLGSAELFAAFPTPATIRIENDMDVTSYAAYGQASYAVTDRLNVTAGLRYSYESKDFTVGLFGSGFLPPVLLPTVELSEDWPAWTPKLGVDYQLMENAMVYASVSRGFKSGGFNFTSPQPAF